MSPNISALSQRIPALHESGPALFPNDAALCDFWNPTYEFVSPKFQTVPAVCAFAGHVYQTVSYTCDFVGDNGSERQTDADNSS